MGECRTDCCDCRTDCCDNRHDCCDCRHDCCNCNEGGNFWTILILFLVFYLLFCGNDNRGGLFGGLF